jgi:hypothetical protein
MAAETQPATREEAMTQGLKKQADGSYAGEYRGHVFVVRKVEKYQRADTWVASSTDGGGIETRSESTRADAVKSFCHKVDREAVNVPELETMLARYTKAVEELVPLLQDNADARLELSFLAKDLRRFDDMVRLYVVDLERKLAKLKRHARPTSPAPAEIQQS